MKYDVILFDADETLYDFKKSEKEAFKSSMIEFKFDYEENYHLEVYKNILKADPTNKEAGSAIRRLSGLRRKNTQANSQMLEFFINLKTEEEIREFKRWLVKI